MPITIKIILILAWLIFGYLYWRAVHYGSIKYFYKRFGEDYTNIAESSEWYKVACPIITLAGFMNLPISFLSGQMTGLSFRYGITLYFKIPK